MNLKVEGLLGEIVSSIVIESGISFQAQCSSARQQQHANCK